MPAKNNSAIYEHFRGDEEFVKRMQDRLDQVERSFRILYTPFLTPAQQQICMQMLGKQYSYQMSGGYPLAEYQCLALYPDQSYEREVQLPITCLKANYSSKYGVLEHRDVLGALMHLGIRREQFGDIFLQNDAIYVFVQNDIKEFVKANCIKIARYSILFEEYDGELQHQMQLKYQASILRSLRLDVVVSTITKQSRGKAQAMIHSQLVKVNHQILEDCSYLCNNNSILSIRGYGRFLLCLKNRKTKKGNMVVEIGKYM